LRLHATGQIVEADACFERVLEVRPSDEKALLVLAQDELSRTRMEAAWNHLATLSTYHPANKEGRRILGSWYVRKATIASSMQRAEEAEGTLRTGIAACPEFTALYINLGALLAGQGKYAEACPPLETFLDRAPDELVGYVYLSQSLLALHKPAEAMNVLERGVTAARKVEATPQNQQWVERLSQLWAEASAALSRE